MTTGTLDRRTLLILAGGVSLVLVVRFVVMTDKKPEAAAPVFESVPSAEQRGEVARDRCHRAGKRKSREAACR